MYRMRIIAALVAILTLSACRGLAPGAGVPTPKLPAEEPAPRETPEPTPCALGGGIWEVTYVDISELARLASAISIAEVVRVSDLRYSTESGARPSCEYMEDAQGAVSVGRLIEMREQRSVAGKAKIAETLAYWLPGGSLNGDTTASHHFGLNAPAVGDNLLAFLGAEPVDLDPGTGTLDVRAFELLPIGQDGRIRTPNADEDVTIEEVDELVDDEVSSP